MKEMKEEQLDYQIISENIAKYDLSFKIIIIGNSGVGKSCLTIQATENVFYSNNASTIGFDIFNFNVKLHDKTIHLQIWDTLGQEKYRSLIRNFYTNSLLAIIVFAIDE